MKWAAIGLCGGLLVACGPKADKNQPVGNASEAVVANEAAPAPEANSAAADDRTPLPEPNGPIDPKSVEAAGQVVQHYGALIERGRWPKAEKLWGDIDAARAFATDLGSRFGELHLEIGNLGEPEGAAGSIYVTEPVVFYGKARKSGKDLRLPADIVLRRVNDVPGSTDAQRRWHIERIELKKTA
jgi:hypothetical protein